MRDNDSQNDFAAFDELERAPHRDALRVIVARLIRSLGGERFVFLLMPAEGTMHHRFDDDAVLTDAARGWLSVYRERRWFDADPGIAYARRSSIPTVAASITPQTDAQHALRIHDAAHGFGAKLIAPAHLPTLYLSGVLYVGCAAREAEPALQAKRMLFRLLASALLDWHVGQIRRDVARSLALTERETGLLRLLRSGCTRPRHRQGIERGGTDGLWVLQATQREIRRQSYFTDGQASRHARLIGSVNDPIKDELRGIFLM